MKDYEGQSVIFVCTGNTCRSPMAEAIFRFEARRRGLPVTVSSAGTDVAEGSGMHLHSLRTLANHGLSIENFTSSMLTAERIEGATAIICMTTEQKARVAYFCDCSLPGNAKERVYAFADFCGYAIPDPYGGSMEVYEATFNALEGGMSAIIERLFPIKDVAKKQEKPKTSKPRAPRKKATDGQGEKKPKTTKKSTAATPKKNTKKEKTQ